MSMIIFAVSVVQDGHHLTNNIYIYFFLMKLTFHQVLLIGLLFFVFITMTMNSNFFGVESKQFFFFLGGGG